VEPQVVDTVGYCVGPPDRDTVGIFDGRNCVGFKDGFESEESMGENVGSEDETTEALIVDAIDEETVEF